MQNKFQSHFPRYWHLKSWTTLQDNPGGLYMTILGIVHDNQDCTWQFWGLYMTIRIVHDNSGDCTWQSGLYMTIRNVHVQSWDKFLKTRQTYQNNATQPLQCVSCPLYTLRKWPHYAYDIWLANICLKNFDWTKDMQMRGLSCRIVMYNPDCQVQSWLSCTILGIVMYNPGQSWGLSCTILIVMYNPDCHVQSWLSCTILIVMYNPDCHVQSWLSCTILGNVMYNPGQSWGLSCTILIVMYNPGDCHVQSWLSYTILDNPGDCHVQSWWSCTILEIVMYNPDCHVQS